MRGNATIQKALQKALDAAKRGFLLNKKIKYKKLNQDDILEILIEHFQDDEFQELEYAKGCLLGKIDEDLRFIGVYGDESCIAEINSSIEEIDINFDFNGDHEVLKNNSEFQIKQTKNK